MSIYDNCPTIYSNKVLCFSTIYIRSISGGAQAEGIFIKHLQSTDAADFHHGGCNQGQAQGNNIQYTLTFITYIELNELIPNSNDESAGGHLLLTLLQLLDATPV